MAFFSEVKAKLGLDITPFERGLKQAQNSVGGLGKGLSKQFMGTEKMAGALAAALGLNMQSIADSIARFFTGFSKDAEAQLENLVNKTEEAARKQEAALADAQRKNERLREGIAKKEEDFRVSRLTDQQRINELSSEQGKLMTEVYQYEKKGQTTATRYLEIKDRLLDVQKELDATEKKMAKEQEDKDENQRRKQGELSAARRKYAYDAMSDEKKLLYLAEERRMLSGTTNIDAQLRIVEIDTERDAILKKQTDSLKEQTKELGNQRKTIKQTLAEYEASARGALLPTSEDVRSGKRNIGSGARSKLNQLSREEEKARRLADAEQRKMEELGAAKSEGDKRRILEEGRALRTQKEQSLGRIEKLKGGLEGRVSDVETARKSYEELTKIEKGIGELNKKLAPSSLTK